MAPRLFRDRPRPGVQSQWTTPRPCRPLPGNRKAKQHTDIGREGHTGRCNRIKNSRPAQRGNMANAVPERCKAKTAERAAHQSNTDGDLDGLDFTPVLWQPPPEIESGE